MKKWMSLLLAVVMALSLCVTAFAGSDTGARVYLTGDAADEVTGLKNGQRFTGSGDVAVRLNVQSDPEAEEYSVKLNGQTLEADHHTAQYHVYYMPAAALSAKAATLSVNARSSAATPTVTVKVGNETRTVTLPADGSTSASSPTEVTAAEFANPGDEAVLDRIYVSCDDEAVALGTGLSNGKITSPLVKLGGGYTGDGLYFYKTPAALSKDAYAAWTDGETTRYYKIVASRGVQSGLVLGPTSGVYDASPREAGASNKYSETDGFLKTMAGYNMMGTVVCYTAQGVFVNGDPKKINSMASVTADPDWDELTKNSKGMYYIDSDNYYAYFARAGRYWLPISYTGEYGSISGYAPINARLAYKDTADYYIDKANKVKSVEGVSADALKELNDAIDTVSANASTFNTSLRYNADGEYVLQGASDATSVQVLDYFGMQCYAEVLYESDINTILDLTAIFTTWGTDATLAGYQWQAYQKLTALGINGIIDVDSLADRDAYQAIRQAKWDLIHTTSEAGDEDAAIAAVNAVLKGEALTAAVQAAGLGALTEVTKQQTEPSVIYGDIDGNGTAGEIYDVIKIIEYYNDPQSEANRLTEEQLRAADVNADGKVDLWDVIEMIEVYNGVAAGYTGAAKTNGGAE